ncbi:SDR family NAD(P)-dependent oxidoreductase, partial [Paenibacillus sepulcri]|nr:SDR family NAD(P)-dependent oxidoreductase [Paenibacillus sepulcri]
MNQHSITHPYVGMWVTKDGHIRQELLPDGRYDEARGKRKSAYTGSYSVKGNRIDYVDDTGFTADGEFRDDVLYHGGMTFTGRKKMYNNISKKVVAITGASSGIGEAAARLLAANGAHVVLGARRRDRLEAAVKAIRAEGGSAEYQALDVTSREQMEAFIGFAKDKFGHVDVIVNNAGVMPLSKLEALKVDEWDRMIDVNIRGVLHGIAAGLPIMQKQGFGQFINVASIGAYGVVPTAAVYSATKY